MLENHTDVFPQFIDIDLFIGNIHTVYDHVAGGDLLQTIQAPQKSGFSAARRTDHNDHFSFIDIGGYAF